jgi:protein required for attachment to host cells
MPKGKNFKKNPILLGYRTSDRFKRMAIKRNIRNMAMTARPRSLGGHR